MNKRNQHSPHSIRRNTEAEFLTFCLFPQKAKLKSARPEYNLQALLSTKQLLKEALCRFRFLAWKEQSRILFLHFPRKQKVLFFQTGAKLYIQAEDLSCFQEISSILFAVFSSLKIDGSVSFSA